LLADPSFWRCAFFAIVVLSFSIPRPVLHGNFSLANFAGLFDNTCAPRQHAGLCQPCRTLCHRDRRAGRYVVTRWRSAWRPCLDVVATLPFAVAGTVLAIGFVMSFNTGPRC